MDIETLKKIAFLSRLELNENEIHQQVENLNKVLNFFNSVSEVNTQNVEPLITPTHIDSFWRNDQVDKKISTEDLLESAPDRAGNLYKVPPVV